MSNHLELSPELFKAAFGDTLNEKKERGIKFILPVFVVFCKADKKEITEPAIVLKSDVFVCLMEQTSIKGLTLPANRSKKESMSL